MSLFNIKPEAEDPIEQTLTLEEVCDWVPTNLAAEKNYQYAKLFNQATAGDKDAYVKCLKIINEILSANKITVRGYSDNVAKEIFKNTHGLAEIDSFFKDPTVHEIRVAPGGQVFITQQGIHKATEIKLSDERVMQLIQRLSPHNDTGSSLNTSSPTMELVRPDGARLAAACAPVSHGPCFALRKRWEMEYVPQNFIEMQTMDMRLWNILSTLVKGRRNILVCGGTNSGKTTLVKLLVGELPKGLAIRVLDLDNELRISELYPERDIWEFEAHAEFGADMASLFALILRTTPDVIIVPEFRGKGEVGVAIEANTRGHEGSMATAHYSSFASVLEVIRNIAMLAIKEGNNLQLDLMMERVAQAFNIVIQTYSDSLRGIKKITAVSEVVFDEGDVTINPLVKWHPFNEVDYTGPGEWMVLNEPTDRCIQGMEIFGVAPEVIRRAFYGDSL